jgi:hypothetical protein
MSRLDDIIDGTFGICEGQCERRTTLILTPSQTQYDWDGKGMDPNRDRRLCDECSEEYTTAMEDQWKEYWSGRL